MITKQREELIDKFQRWLEPHPLPRIIAEEYANIAEEYAKQKAWELLRTYSMKMHENAEKLGIEMEHPFDEARLQDYFEIYWKENNK